MSTSTQSNTIVGDIRVIAGEDLTGMEGRLVKIASSSGTPVAKLPENIADYALYVLTEGGAAGERVTLRPLSPDRQVWVRLNSTCAPGDVLVLEAISGGNQGKLRKLPTGSGTYRGLAIAEETGADEQLVLCRPAMIGNIVVS